MILNVGGLEKTPAHPQQCHSDVEGGAEMLSQVVRLSSEFSDSLEYLSKI